MRHRLLFLLPFPPRAGGRHGGARAIAQLLRRIAARHSVAVLYLREASEEPMDDDLASLCEVVHAIPRSAPRVSGIRQRIQRRVRFLGSLVAGKPIWVQAVDVPAFGAAAERLAADWHPDLVQLDYHVMGQYLDSLDGNAAPRLLMLHEPGEDGVGRAYAKPSPLLLWLDRRAWRSFERRVLRKVQCVVALTEGDRASIARRGIDVPIETIPLGVEIPSAAADPVGASPPTVLFVGNFRHDPNVDAALRLVHDIWPLVEERNADAVLSLVGDAPPAELASTARARVQVLGGVPDVAPFLNRAAVCVAPLRRGGGMRVKVIEAFAAGKAVVASPLAVAGLAVEPRRHFLEATTDAEFAAAIVELLEDAALRRSLAVAVRDWAADNVSAEQTAAAFERLYQRTIAAP